MELNLTTQEFRMLLDMVYIGNWVLNSTRGNDRFDEYDRIQNKLFGQCRNTSLRSLTELQQGTSIPSKAYLYGGIHDAIAYYEDNIFYEILAEELSRRDMDYPEVTPENYPEIIRRINQYIDEFEQSGVDHLILDSQS